MPTLDDRIANLQKAASDARAIARQLEHRGRTVLAARRTEAAEEFDREAAQLKRTKERREAWLR